MKERARELGYDELRAGFNTTPLFGPPVSFGLTTDDYTPKPASETYRALVDRHG
ncbi:hypothetical protein [Streptomyces werraensis]|uniref:hypothetical protein n=1 Tax=Streptomyces werraensis TaxID=68284 RepID=UPI0036AE834C